MLATPTSSTPTSTSPPSVFSTASKDTTDTTPLDKASGPDHRGYIDKIPDFFGDREGYAAWRSKMLVTFRCEGNTTGELDKVARIWLAMKGKAVSMCAPFFIDFVEEANPTVDDAVKYLDKRFAEEDKYLAIDQWVHLQQGNTPFAEFFEEFERLMARAGGQNLGEEFKMYYLEKATSRGIKQLAAVKQVNTMQEQATLYHRIARNLARFDKQEASSSETWTLPTAPAAVPDNGDRMEGDISGSFSAQTRKGRGRGGYRGGRSETVTPVNPNGGQGPGLPDDALYRGYKARRATAEELHQRRRANACLRCGRLGCRTSVCPLVAYRPPPPAEVNESG